MNEDGSTLRASAIGRGPDTETDEARELTRAIEQAERRKYPPIPFGTVIPRHFTCKRPRWVWNGHEVICLNCEKGEA